MLGDLCWERCLGDDGNRLQRRDNQSIEGDMIKTLRHTTPKEVARTAVCKRKAHPGWPRKVLFISNRHSRRAIRILCYGFQEGGDQVRMPLFDKPRAIERYHDDGSGSCGSSFLASCYSYEGSLVGEPVELKVRLGLVRQWL